MLKISPSILSADFARLGEELQAINDGGAQWVHLDVMDGHFVPNISFGVPVVESLRKEAMRRGLNLVFDVHLMIAEPADYVAAFAKAGADIITFHSEACRDNEEVLEIVKLIRSHGKKAGVAVNPDTPICRLLEIARSIDMALIMSVVPGFGGQGFIEHTLDKARALRDFVSEHNLDLDIQMDGGVKLSNMHKVLEAGVNVIVVGSAIYAAEDVALETQKYIEVFVGAHSVRPQ